MLLPFFVVVMVESQPLINEIEDRIDRVFHIEEHGKYFEEAGKSLGKALDKVEDQAEEEQEGGDGAGGGVEGHPGRGEHHDGGGRQHHCEPVLRDGLPDAQSTCPTARRAWDEKRRGCSKTFSCCRHQRWW